MCRKIVLLMCLILLLGLSNNVSASLVGHWSFDDQTANDSSGNGHNGTLTGNAAIINDGTRGYVLSLDGAGDYVSLGTGAWTNPGNHATMAAWIKVDNFDVAYQTVVAKGNSTYRLHRNNTANSMAAHMNYTSSSYKAVYGNNSVNNGQWHHAAMTYDGSALKLYVDGNLDGTNGLSSLYTTSANLCIGRNVDQTTRDWEGQIDDVYFYDNALTQTEIRVLAGWTVTISGNTGSLDGVTMNGLPGNPITSGGGAYSATVQYGWSGTVTPSKAGYTFSPANMTYANLTVNQTAQNYTPTILTYTISGTVGTLDGVTMIGLPGEPVTSGGGAYSATVEYGWNGVAAPEKEGYTFSPAERLYTNVTSNQSSQDYTPTLITFTISGYVGLLEDVTMNGLPGNPTTDENGYYIGTVDYGWEGTVTPTKGNCAFEPSYIIYSPVVEDQNEQNYTSIADADLVGWWPLKGDADDYSGYGNNGTVTGAEYVNSEIGTVLDFEGVDYVSIPSTAFSSISTEITIAVWLNGDAAFQPQENCIFEGTRSVSKTLNCHVPWSTGGIFFDAGYATGYDRITKMADSASQYEGQWNHWAFTKNTATGQMKIYFNGQLWHSGTGKTRSMSGINLFKIGSTASGVNNYDGMISDFRLYDKELSATEIDGLYNASYEASNPYPADGAINVPVDAVLSWAAGYLAGDVNGHDVYFSTSWEDINSVNPEVHMGLQSGTTFDPGLLESGVTYFWEVNEVNDAYANSPWKGKIWSFTTTDANLVGWWPLNGNADDRTGYGNNGTITGAAWVEDIAMGTVLDFEGVDYVSIPTAAFSSISDQVTIAMWQYGDAAIQPQNNSIFEGANSGSNRVLSSNLPWSTSMVYWDAGYVGGYDRINKTAVANEYEGKWNHWAFTKNTTTGEMKIYLNGQLWQSGTGKTKSMTGITSFKIGSAANGTQNYDGMICDFRVYDAELSQTRINNIYGASMRYEALNPFPADNAVDVPVTTSLTWTAGYRAADVDGHDVYFGTNFDDVNDRVAAVHMGLQSDAAFDPGVLDSNATYYWAVDEINDIYEDSPWLGQVWSFTTSQSGLPPMPDDVTCNNSHLMLGNIRGVAFPINWPTVGCDYTQAQIASSCRILSDNWYNRSRGKAQMVGRDGTGTQFTTLSVAECAVPYAKKSSNETAAHDYLIDLHNIPSSTIKWFINSGNSVANSGGTTCDTYSMQVYTATHEFGHLFRLGHGMLLKYNSDGTYNSVDAYGDRTTDMGNVSAGGWNLPGYHRLNWIEENEVAVFHKEDSGTVYRIRSIKKITDTANWAGVVYYLPVTGNRMWISVTQREQYGNDYLGNQLALTKYVTPWHMTSDMQRTFCIKHMAGAHTDCYGLTYEVVAIDTSANRAWADIRITYNPANETCNKQLVIKPTLRLLQPVSAGKRGQMEVTIDVTNPNAPTTVPAIQQRHDLSVANSYKVTTNVYMTPYIAGGTTVRAVFVVESKLGPLSYQDSHLTGKFQLAHLYPFEFEINFE